TRFSRDWSSDVCSSDLRGETLVHRWFFNDVLQAEVKLSVAGDRWRTWSRKNIGNNRDGSWKVTVVTASGCELANRQLSSDTPLRSEERRVGKGWSTRWK